MRKVEVIAYTNEWSKKFDQEAQLIHHIMGQEIIDIHHIGSTSVPGLKAKPIIDMMPVVRDISKVDNYIHKMEDAGYEALGENGLPGRRYFRKGGDNRTHHVHVFEEGHPDVERHLVFRDYLCSHPKDMRAYGDLKESLANTYPTNIDAYIDGKDQLVKDIERRAIEWRQNR